jgi:hypothetical protein
MTTQWPKVRLGRCSKSVRGRRVPTPREWQFWGRLTYCGLELSELFPDLSRLEDADYAGHSLTMLERIAHALGHRLCIHFVPQDEPCTTSR